MRVSLIALSLAASAFAVPALAQDSAAAIAAAVADSARPAADTARDAARKPAQAVAFAGVKPGDTVAELAPGGGYYTRILAKAVGPQGRVFAIVSPGQAARPGALDGLNALAAQYGNVTVVTTDYTAMELPAPADLVWTTENWHDFHNGPTANPAGIAASAFSVLKPGGLFFVEDHSAPGTGTSATSTLHRIDPEAVKAIVTGAGFALDDEGDFMRNPADPHTAGAHDPSIRGETDKFTLRFKKPG